MELRRCTPAAQKCINTPSRADGHTKSGKVGNLIQKNDESRVLINLCFQRSLEQNMRAGGHTKQEIIENPVQNCSVTSRRDTFFSSKYDSVHMHKDTVLTQ